MLRILFSIFFMFSSRFMIFPTFKKNNLNLVSNKIYSGNKCTYSYWLNGRWFHQIVDIGNFNMRLEILKSSPSLTG